MAMDGDQRSHSLSWFNLRCTSFGVGLDQRVEKASHGFDSGFALSWIERRHSPQDFRFDILVKMRLSRSVLWEINL